MSGAENTKNLKCIFTNLSVLPVERLSPTGYIDGECTYVHSVEKY